MYTYVWLCIPVYGYVSLCMLRKPVYSYVFLYMDMHTNAGLYIPVYGYVYLCTAMYIWPYTGVRSSTKGYIHTCVRLRLSVYGNV